MITNEDIEKYIERIPPAPKIVEATLRYLRVGELAKAAKIAKEDLALSSYLRTIVNKPIYGFKNEVKDIAQIFSILGVSRSQQVVYNYMMQLLSPKKWYFFKLNEKSFQEFQDELGARWSKIVAHLGVDDKEVESSIALLPASVIVAEALFNEKKEDVALIRSAKDIDLNTILRRLSGYDLFDICGMIAKKWEMDDTIVAIIQAASGKEEVRVDTQALLFGKWMHLLLFYVVSKPRFIDAGLNDFIEFNVTFVEDIYEEFMQIMEISS